MKKWAIFTVVVLHLLDVFTSVLPGGEETNEFARNAAHQALASHLYAIKFVYLGMYLLLGWMVYTQIRRLSQRLADLFTVVICCYLSLDMFPIVIANGLLYLNWYQK